MSVELRSDGLYHVTVNGVDHGGWPDEASAHQADADIAAGKNRQGAQQPGQSTTPPMGNESDLGKHTYNTREGSKSAQQMLDELDRAAGGRWTGDRANPDAVFTAYQNVGQSPGATGTGGTSGNTMYDPGAAGYALQLATISAQTAANKAALEWQKQYQGAVLSGTYEGNPTLDMQRFIQDKAQAAFNNTIQQGQLDIQKGQLGVQQGQLTGEFNGKPTLAGQQLGLQTGQVLGQYGGNPTLEAQIAQGNINGSPTLAAQQLQQNTALGYLDLLAKLRGPENAFQYAKVLSGTPGGLSDIVRAASGEYTLPGYGQSQGQPTPASLSGLIGDATGQGGQGGNQVTMPGQGQQSPGLAAALANPQQTMQHAYALSDQWRKDHPGQPWTQQATIEVYGQMGIPPGVAADLYQQAQATGAPNDPNMFARMLKGAAQRAGNTSIGQYQPQPTPGTPQVPGETPSPMAGAQATGQFAPPRMQIAPIGEAQPVASTGQAADAAYQQAMAAQPDNQYLQGGQYLADKQAWEAQHGPLGPQQGGPAMQGRGMVANLGTGQTNNTAQGAQPSWAIPQYGALPAPSQINSANYRAMSPTQQSLLMGAYESQGWDKNDVLAQYKASLPKYGGAYAGRMGF